MTIKLPEPDYKVMFNGEWRNLYYEESLKQAIKDALEEAATAAWDAFGNNEARHAIRKLKDQL